MDDESTYERLKSLGYGGAMRSHFSLEEDYIQLNHGSVSAPSSVHATAPSAPGDNQPVDMRSTVLSPKWSRPVTVRSPSAANSILTAGSGSTVRSWQRRAASSPSRSRHAGRKTL